MKRTLAALGLALAAVLAAPGTAQATSEPCPDDSPRTYVVKPGDTLWRIAVHRYGTGHRWTVIAKANGIRDPRRVRPGTVLRFPC